MDELWEAVSWAQLGYHAKPVGLLNAFGFFDARSGEGHGDGCRRLPPAIAR
jgi:hypothetical protein